MIVGLLGPGGCGGTFLDWSLYFLSDQESRWFADCAQPTRDNIVMQCSVPVDSNPLTTNTAHVHDKNHPNENSINDLISSLELHTEFPLNSFYYVDSLDRGTRSITNHNLVVAQHPAVKFINYVFDRSDTDVIFCFQMEKIKVMRELYLNIVSNGQTIRDMPTWDRREFLSLYYPKCVEGQTMSEGAIDATNVYNFKFKTMIYSLETEIVQIFNWLGLPIDLEKFEVWKTVYRQWQANNRTAFFENLDDIVNCVIGGHNHDLTSYNLTFAKEVVLASKLLYKHNKTLKSYGVDALDKNTMQWTDILENNVYHNIMELE